MSLLFSLNLVHLKLDPSLVLCTRLSVRLVQHPEVIVKKKPREVTLLEGMRPCAHQLEVILKKKPREVTSPDQGVLLLSYVTN
jgi:hypothetical protein